MWIAHEQHMPLWSEYPHLAPITGQTGYRTCLVPLKHPIKPCQVGSLNVHLVRSHHHKHLQEQLAPHFNSYLLQRLDGLRERTALRLFFRLQLEVYQVQVGHCQDIYARMLGCTLIEYGSKFDVKTATHTHLLHMYPQYTMHTHTQVYSTFWPGCPKRGGGGTPLSFLQVVGIFDVVIIGSPTPLILPALGKTISQKWAKLLQESMKISKQEN